MVLFPPPLQQHNAQLKAFLDKMNSEFAEIEKVELNVKKISPSEALRDIQTS